MKTIDLCGIWSLRAVGEDTSFPVTVPGSVLSCYIENGVIDDPFYRDNEYAANELFWKDYEFTRSFEVTETDFGRKKIELVCFGLDTLCDIYINGQKIAETDNMHRTYIFDVKKYVKAGENLIRIVCRSVHRFRTEYEDSRGREIHNVQEGGTKGNEYIRKAHSMFGWDWGPAIPDAGIWRNIEVRCSDGAVIDEVIFHQEHRSGAVVLKVDARLSDADSMEANRKVSVTVISPDGRQTRSACAAAENGCAQLAFDIAEPELWWPAGLGEHPLYTVKVASDDDEKEYRIGLRTLTVSQYKDEWGSEFCFIVNGVKFFAMGANYIPEDVVYSRITPDRTRKLIEDAVRANYNTLRVWGGGYYPWDEFYDICDELGVVVWQDFMFACNVYDVSEHFAENVAAEVRDNVRRLRHHASLGLWCGNNEIESAWVGWDSFKGHDESFIDDYLHLFEDVIPKTLRENDDVTFYWPSSPSSYGTFKDTENENVGDIHYWKVWHGFLPFDDYRKHFFRFCSEFGFQSFPLEKTVEAYTLPEDRNVFSEVMESHQKNSSANGKILAYLAQNFLYPKDFSSLLYVSQILQAMAMKTGVEHFRRNRGRCMGALYWQINDNWPVASWASIDYYGRWKACQYYAADFYAPLAGSLLVENDKAAVWTANEGKSERTMKVIVRVKTIDFSILAQESFEKTVPAFSSVLIGEVAIPDTVRGRESECFVEAIFTDDSGRSRTEVTPIKLYKHMKLAKPNISCEMTEYEDRYEYRLRSDSFAPFTELVLKNGDGIFSENYIHLTGDEHRVILMKSDITGESDGEVTVRSLRDTY